MYMYMYNIVIHSILHVTHTMRTTQHYYTTLPRESTKCYLRSKVRPGLEPRNPCRDKELHVAEWLGLNTLTVSLPVPGQPINPMKHA